MESDDESLMRLVDKHIKLMINGGDTNERILARRRES